MGFRGGRWFAAIVLILSLGACGGGYTVASGGTGGSGISGGTGGTGMSVGTITRFGSIFVNGVEYDVTNATITIGGNATPVNQSQLAAGMVVTVNGSVNTNGVSGSATTVNFSDTLQGTVDSNTISSASQTGTFVAMGQRVLVGKNTVFVGDAAHATIDTVPVGAVVEVSGYSNGGSSTIHASLVRLIDTSWNSETLELKGLVSHLDTTAQTFKIGALTIDYSSPQAGINLQGQSFRNGLYVKVESTGGYNGSGQLIASSVALENGGISGVKATDGTALTLEGVVTGALSAGQFVLNGQTVQVGSQTVYNNGDQTGIVLDAQLVVRGQMQSGVLVADTITYAASDSALSTLVGYVSDVYVSSGTLILMGQTIYVDNNTLFEDATGVAGQYFNLANVASGDRLVVNVYQNAAGNWVATKLKRVN